MGVPSETEAGRAWLGNFAAPERVHAALLLDSIRVFTADEIRLQLRLRAEELLGSGVIRKPAVFYPVRDDLPGSGPHVAFDNFNPASPLGVLPGSEALMAQVVRDLTGIGRSPTPGTMRPTPSLEELRVNRCRTIVLIEQNSGSGQQIATYADTWPRQRTIRSWRSRDYVQVHVLVFAATTRATARLRARRSIDEVWVVEAMDDGLSAFWSHEQRSAVEDLCRRYAAPSFRKSALGYQGSLGLAVTPTVPNNLPAILLQPTGQTHDGFRWVPMFPRRNFPAALQQEIGGYRPSKEQAVAASLLGQVRLSKALRQQRHDPATAMLIVLAARLRRWYEVPELATLLDQPVREVERLLVGMTSLGLLNELGGLTVAGRRELSVNKRLARGMSLKLAAPDADPYYPQQLRGAGGI